MQKSKKKVIVIADKYKCERTVMQYKGHTSSYSFSTFHTFSGGADTLRSLPVSIMFGKNTYESTFSRLSKPSYKPVFATVMYCIIRVCSCCQN